MTIKTDNLYFQKLKNSFCKLQNMHICCKTCKKHTGNTFSKKKKSTDFKGKSKCTFCLTKKTFLMKLKTNMI